MFLLIPPYNFKKFQRSTLRQRLLDEKNHDEGNEVILSSAGVVEEESLTENDSVKALNTVILKSHLKKKTRLGFFYKRAVTLTSDAKIIYRKDKGLVKEIPLTPESIRLERLDKTKFKILEQSK